MDQHISEEHGGMNIEEHGDVSIEGEDHDPMEDDDHLSKNTFEDDGTNALIHDTFGIGVVVDDDEEEEE